MSRMWTLSKLLMTKICLRCTKQFDESKWADKCPWCSYSFENESSGEVQESPIGVTRSMQSFRFKHSFEGQRVIFTVPHAEGYDLNAKEYANALGDILSANGVENKVFLGDVSRDEQDLNRPDARDTDFRQAILKELTPNDFLIDVHTYPYEDERYGKYEIVILDAPLETNNDYSYKLFDFLNEAKLNVEMQRGYTRDDILLQTQRAGIQSTLIEICDEVNPDELLPVIAKAIMDVLEYYNDNDGIFTEDLTTGNAGGALTAVSLPDKVKPAVEPTPLNPGKYKKIIVKKPKQYKTAPGAQKEELTDYTESMKVFGEKSIRDMKDEMAMHLYGKPYGQLDQRQAVDIDFEIEGRGGNQGGNDPQGYTNKDNYKWGNRSEALVQIFEYELAKATKELVSKVDAELLKETYYHLPVTTKKPRTRTCGNCEHFAPRKKQCKLNTIGVEEADGCNRFSRIQSADDFEMETENDLTDVTKEATAGYSQNISEFPKVMPSGAQLLDTPINPAQKDLNELTPRPTKSLMSDGIQCHYCRYVNDIAWEICQKCGKPLRNPKPTITYEDNDDIENIGDVKPWL